MSIFRYSEHRVRSRCLLVCRPQKVMQLQDTEVLYRNTLMWVSQVQTSLLAKYLVSCSKKFLFVYRVDKITETPNKI